MKFGSIVNSKKVIVIILGVMALWRVSAVLATELIWMFKCPIQNTCEQKRCEWLCAISPVPALQKKYGSVTSYLSNDLVNAEYPQPTLVWAAAVMAVCVVTPGVILAFLLALRNSPKAAGVMLFIGAFFGGIMSLYAVGWAATSPGLKGVMTVYFYSTLDLLIPFVGVWGYKVFSAHAEKRAGG